VTGSVIPHQ